MSILIAVALLIGLAEWRWGVLMVAVAGVGQEVVRKLVPGAPVSVVLLVGVCFMASLAGKFMRHGSLGAADLLGQFRDLRAPLFLTALLLAGQFLATLVRFQNLPLLGIGAISYVFPLLAILLGRAYALSGAGGVGPVRAYLLLYIGVVTLGASGILLSFLGWDSVLVRPVGEALLLYDESGIMQSYCGFFRSSEIAAWHTGAALCLLLTLASVPGSRALRLAAVALAPFLLAMAVLTGRRKVLMVVIIFVSVSSFLLLRLRQSRRTVYPLVFLVLGIGVALYAGNFFDLSTPREKLGAYLRRGGTVFEDAPERFSLLGVQSVWWAIEAFGLFGVGAGVLGQGGQHFGAGGEVFGGSGEGGLGKITGELGLPGLALFLWIGALAVRHAGRVLRGAAEAGPGERAVAVGLVSLLAANVPSFIVASQAYGDPFVILSLGLFAGFAIALGGDAGQQEAAAAAEAGPEPAPPTHAPPRPWGRV